MKKYSVIIFAFLMVSVASAYGKDKKTILSAKQIEILNIARKAVEENDNWINKAEFESPSFNNLYGMPVKKYHV